MAKGIPVVMIIIIHRNLNLLTCLSLKFIYLNKVHQGLEQVPFSMSYASFFQLLPLGKKR